MLRPGPLAAALLFTASAFIFPGLISPGVNSPGLISQSLADPLSAQRQSDLLHLLIQDCGSCHGLTMKGGLGPPLLPENLDSKDNETLAEIILDGLPGTPMPPWRPHLEPREAAWMVEQLKEGLAP